MSDDTNAKQQYHDDSEDVKVIREEDSLSNDLSTRLGLDEAAKYKDLLVKFAELGRTIADTYSEENQNSADGFINALKEIEDMRKKLRDMPESMFTVAEKDSLYDLMDYLKGKLQKRARAVDHNDLNM